MNYSQILKKGENFLKKSKIKNPNLDTELILSKVINKKREEILLNTNNKLKIKDIIKFKNYLLRRHQKEPIAYILGYKYFWKHKFLTNKSVLIPRPDTELIIEEALKYLPIDKSKKILDIGTGSGCILISLLSELKGSRGLGVDISTKAVEVAKIKITQFNCNRAYSGPDEPQAADSRGYLSIYRRGAKRHGGHSSTTDIFARPVARLEMHVLQKPPACLGGLAWVGVGRAGAEIAPPAASSPSPGSTRRRHPGVARAAHERASGE